MKGSKQTILRYLVEHPLTGLTSSQAFELFGVTRLSARIYDLRNKGYQIDTLMTFKEELSNYKYLSDVDKMWNSVSKLENDNIVRLNEMEKQELKITNINDIIEGQNENIQCLKNNNKELTDKLRMAYVIAGISVGVSVIHIVLSMIGII